MDDPLEIGSRPDSLIKHCLQYTQTAFSTVYYTSQIIYCSGVQFKTCKMSVTISVFLQETSYIILRAVQKLKTEISGSRSCKPWSVSDITFTSEKPARSSDLDTNSIERCKSKNF